MKLLNLLLSLTFIFIANGLIAQDKGDPKKTEVWEPEPVAITPGHFNAPPSDAVVLFDGTSLKNFVNSKGETPEWVVAEGSMTVKPGSGPIFTKQGFQDVQIHLEWKAPGDTTGLVGQQRNNSGVFFQNKYEVQILDSYKNRTYSNGQATSVYKQHIPLVNACRPPGEWQVYDIIYTAPRFNEDGTFKSNPYITVLHNGVLVQNHVKLEGTTEYIGPPKVTPHEDKLPIQLQDHGNYVSFRNIWLREL